MGSLAEGLNFPWPARALGEEVEVVGLDEAASSRQRGILARVRKGEQEYRIGLAELEPLKLDASSAEWLAAYQYWLGEEDDFEG